MQTGCDIEKVIVGRVTLMTAFGMMLPCKDYLKDRSAGRAGLNGYSAVNIGVRPPYDFKIYFEQFIFSS